MLSHYWLEALIARRTYPFAQHRNGGDLHEEEEGQEVLKHKRAIVSSLRSPAYPKGN